MLHIRPDLTTFEKHEINMAYKKKNVRLITIDNILYGIN